MPIHKHLYTFNYDPTESELCKLESRCIFNQEEKNKLLLSDIKVAP
jgi:tRNA (guanine10-N2)-dimethyltransferase